MAREALRQRIAGVRDRKPLGPREMDRGWGHKCGAPMLFASKAFAFSTRVPSTLYQLGAQTCGLMPTPLPVLQPVLTEIPCYLQDFLKHKGFEIKSRRFFPWMLLQCVFLCDGFRVTQ